MQGMSHTEKQMQARTARSACGRTYSTHIRNAQVRSAAWTNTGSQDIMEWWMGITTTRGMHGSMDAHMCAEVE